MSALTADEVEARVARGAALLDERVPGWYRAIDLDDFDLGDPCRCVLGQIGQVGYYASDRPDADADFFDVACALGLAPSRSEVVGATAPYGFAAVSDDIDGDWDDLEAAWARLIKERQQA